MRNAGLFLILTCCCLLKPYANISAQEEGYGFYLATEKDGFKWYHGNFDIDGHTYEGAFDMKKKLITPRDKVERVYYEDGFFLVLPTGFSGPQSLYTRTGRCIIPIYKRFTGIAVHPEEQAIWVTKQQRKGTSNYHSTSVFRGKIARTYGFDGVFWGYGPLGKRDLDDPEYRHRYAHDRYTESLVVPAQEVVWNKKPLEEVVSMVSRQAEKEGYLLCDMNMMEYDDDISWYVCTFDKQGAGQNYSALVNLAGVFLTPIVSNASYKYDEDDERKAHIYVMSNGRLAVYNILGKCIIPFEDGVAEVVADYEGLLTVKNKEGYYRLYDDKGKCIMGKKWGDYDYIELTYEEELIWCRSGNNRTTHSYSGKKIAKGWKERGQIEAELAEQEQHRLQRLDAVASALTSMSEALNQSSSGRQVYSNPSSGSSSSSGTAVYSRNFKDHGYCAALKIWQSFGNTVHQEERVQVTEDNQGSLFLKIGSSYTLLSPNSMKSFLGYPVANCNYSTIYQGVHYFVSVR